MSWSSFQPRLERLREHRVRPERAAPLLADLERMQIDLKRRQRALSGIGAAFAACVPPELAARTTLESCARGVLTVRVPDSSTHHELDRFLRSGGETAIARAAPVGLRRVRVVVGPAK